MVIVRLKFCAKALIHGIVVRGGKLSRQIKVGSDNSGCNSFVSETENEESTFLHATGVINDLKEENQETQAKRLEKKKKKKRNGS